MVCNNFEWLLGLHGLCQFLVPRFKIVTLVLSKGTVPSIMLFATLLTSQFTQLLKSEEYLEYWWYLHWSTRVFLVFDGHGISFITVGITNFSELDEIEHLQ